MTAMVSLLPLFPLLACATSPLVPVICPVCGFEDDERVCARCGTDLDALEGATRA